MNLTSAGITGSNEGRIRSVGIPASFAHFTRHLAAVLLALLVASFATAGHSQMIPTSDPPAFHPGVIRDQALRLGEEIEAPALATLEAASVAARREIAALDENNRRAAPRMQRGFLRPIAARTVEIGGVSAMSAGSLKDEIVRQTADHETVWTAHLTVRDAFSLRLALADVHLPAGTRLWVYAPGHPSTEFSLDMVSPDGELWCPPTGGDTVFLEIRVPASAAMRDEPAHFRIVGVVESFPIDASGHLALERRTTTESAICAVDAACLQSAYFTNIGGGVDVRKAIALLDFMENGVEYICSGGLLAERSNSGLPYLLTANHCFSTQASASSLIAFFDYQSPSCGAHAGSPWLYPATYGATLLQTNATSDFTFVRLAGSPPPGRVYFGWDPRPSSPANATELYRISHPAGNAQSVSTSIVTTSSNYSCLPQSQFVFSSADSGATEGGSSGSPVFTYGGYVVGQLYGKCTLTDDPCSYSLYSVVDGRFSTTYQSIYPWIDPPPTNLRATGSPSRVQLSWNGIANVSSYEIDRAEPGSGHKAVATVQGTTYSDTTVTPSKAYLYCVRGSVRGGTSPWSNVDLATTVSFSDDPLVAESTVIKAVHLSELRSAVNLVRAFAGLPAAFTAPASAGTVVRASDILELRTTLDAALSILVPPTMPYTGANLQGLPVRALHFQEIRDRIR